MDSAIAALKDTPIPTILVVAGIVFLLLSIAGQLAGKIAVPVERQRLAAIIGGVLIVMGITLHVIPPRGIVVPDPTRRPRPSPTPAVRSSEPENEFPTKHEGVTARVTRFGPSGVFTMLEIAVRNRTTKTILICALSSDAELIDQQSGDAWKPENTGGEVESCGYLEPSAQSGTWMQFRIPDPDGRVFTLRSALFNHPVENLAIGQPP